MIYIAIDMTIKKTEQNLYDKDKQLISKGRKRFFKYRSGSFFPSDVASQVEAVKNRIE